MKQSLPQSPRGQAAAVLYKVLNEGAYANLELSAALRNSGFDRRDRSFATQEVYGVLRHLIPIDHYISTFLHAPLKKKEALLQIILRLGFFEILYSDVPGRATVNEMVEMAKAAGPPFWGKLANGVLRNLLRKEGELSPPAFADKAEAAAFSYSLPLWLLRRWQRQWGEAEMLALAAAMNEIAPTHLRVNTLKTDRGALGAVLTAAGVEWSMGSLSPDGIHYVSGPPLEQLEAFRDGLCTVQEEASQMAAIVLDPAPGSRTADLCAAPGGKTGHLAQRMENRGEILAWDIHEHKLALITGNLRRLGITIATVRQGDAGVLPASYDGSFDNVLLDAPCSGLGVLRRRLDARYRVEEGSIAALARLQRDLLARAARLLAPGGRLLYSTCTITREENQDNAAWFLREHPDFAPADIRAAFPSLAAADFEAPHLVQLLPSRHGCEGFFIACFVRKGVPGHV